MRHDYKYLETFIRQLEQKLGLTFIEMEEGNVCMANHNSELRDEFKQSFTMADVRRYIQSLEFKQGGQIPLPYDTESFWKIVSR